MVGDAGDIKLEIREDHPSMAGLLGRNVGECSSQIQELAENISRPEATEFCIAKRT